MHKYLRRFYVEKSIKNFETSGKTLEIGSGKRWKYKQESITQNLDPESEADIIEDARKTSFKKDEFDYILCIEVLEHTETPQELIDEIHRILKKGGKVLLTTPFNFEIHADNDFYRYTKFGLEHLFRNFSEVSISAHGGRASVIFHFVRTTPILKYLYPIWNNLGFSLDTILQRNKDNSKVCLGYEVVAVK